MVRSVRSQFLAVGFLVLVLGLGALILHSYAAGDGQSWGPGAAEQVAANEKLIKSWIKTELVTLNLSTTYADAFALTTVACPGSAPSCTLRIEVVSGYWDVDAGQVARMRVQVNGSPVGVEPASIVNVSTNSSAQWAETATMSWMVKSVVAGSNPSVDVDFQVSGGTAFAGYRTLTIGVYKP